MRGTFCERDVLVGVVEDPTAPRYPAKIESGHSGVIYRYISQIYITDVSRSDSILLKKKIRSSRSTPPQHFPRDAPAKQDPEGEEIKDRGDKDSYKKFYEFPQNCELFSRAL